MLHKVRNAHREILDGLPELKALLPPSVRKKRQLLEMARRGEPRPNFKGHRLGSPLSSYTVKSSEAYSPEFDREIRRLRPDWFLDQTEKAAEKKKLLLEMAIKGGPRPDFRTALRHLLSNYTRKRSDSYDPRFDRRIRELAPHWFLPRNEKTAEKKKLLLKMAREGKPRPSQKTNLGNALSCYLGKKTNSYDPDFDGNIRALRPDWFVSQAEKASQKKELILKMASEGKDRPGEKTKLGMSLKNYLFESSDAHDPVFAKKIRKLAPDWFRKCSTR